MLDTEWLRGELFNLGLNTARRRRHIVRMRAEVREKSAGLKDMQIRKKAVIAELVARGFKITREGKFSKTNDQSE